MLVRGSSWCDQELHAGEQALHAVVSQPVDDGGGSYKPRLTAST